MGKLIRFSAETFAALLAVLILLELTLRLFPGLIPFPLLINFQQDLREVIASRRGLVTAIITRPVERDDGGPPLRVYKPGVTIELPFDRDDAGAVASVTMDKNGFCNPPAAAERIGADILALGDSFSWCVGVRPEDTWISRVSQISGYSAYSLGLGGTGPYEYLELLKKFGLAQSPRVVVMNIYGGNDLRSALTFYQYRAELKERGGREYLVAPCVGLPAPVCFLYRSLKEGFIGRRSYSFNLAANAARDGLLALERRLRPSSAPEEPDFRYRVRIGDKEFLFNRGNADVDDLEYARRLKTGAIALQALDAALLDFTALGRDHGFDPVVSFTPPAYHAYAASAVFEDSSAGELIQWFNDEQRQYFAAKAGEFGYVFADFTPALRQAAERDGELLYFPTNLHLTAAGHALVGQALAGALSRSGILR